MGPCPRTAGDRCSVDQPAAAAPHGARPLVICQPRNQSLNALNQSGNHWIQISLDCRFHASMNQSLHRFSAKSTWFEPINASINQWSLRRHCRTSFRSQTLRRVRSSREFDGVWSFKQSFIELDQGFWFSDPHSIEWSKFNPRSSFDRVEQLCVATTAIRNHSHCIQSSTTWSQSVVFSKSSSCSCSDSPKKAQPTRLHRSNIVTSHQIHLFAAIPSCQHQCSFNSRFRRFDSGTVSQISDHARIS